MTQSTQATKDTASSVASSTFNVCSLASSLTNTSVGGSNTNGVVAINNNGGGGGSNSNGGKVTPVTNALSTAAQVFTHQQSAYTAAGGGGGSSSGGEFVKEWNVMSEDDSFQQHSNNGGEEEEEEFDWPDDAVGNGDDDEGDDYNRRGTANAVPPPSQKAHEVVESVWREAVDPNSGKTYYYNTLTKEASWTIPEDSSSSATPPPPPPPPVSNDASSAIHTAKTPHRSNTSSMQQKQQRQQQQKRRVYSKSPPRARASPSLDSIVEDDDDHYNDEAVHRNDDDGDVNNTNDARTRSKSPFRVIAAARSRSPPVRHASSSFYSDPNRGADGANADGGGGRKSISPFRGFNSNKQQPKPTKNNKKKGRKKPVVNKMPSSLIQQVGNKGSAEVGDVVSLVSYYDDPSIGILSSLDGDTTLASRSLSRRLSSVIAAPSADGVGAASASAAASGGGSERRDASQTPPRNKKHADPPGNSIDEILKKGSVSRAIRNNQYEEHSPHSSRDIYQAAERYQQKQQLPDPSPMRGRWQQQQQHTQHSPYRQHQSPYSGQSPQQQQQQHHHRRSPYKHQQQQQDPPYKEIQQEHRSPYSGQQQHDPPYIEEQTPQRSSYSEQQQYLQQPQIYTDEDENQWMVTPQEVPSHHLQQSRNQEQQQQHTPRQIYYDEEGQPYYYEDDDDDEYGPVEEQYQQLQQKEQSVPPSQLQTPRQGWQWSEQQDPNHQDQYQEEGDYPAEEYFDDGNGNFISFITTDAEEGDHVLRDFESIGMLTGDEEGPHLPNEPADDDTAANTLATVDLVAEVKRVWRHVQRYEQKKSTKTDSRIEKKDSEEELLVHQFTQAFAQASPGRDNKSTAASMTKSSAGVSMTKPSAAGVSATTTFTQRPVYASGAAQISPEREVVSSSRGRGRSKDSRLGEHIRSTSVHSRALSSRGESPATGSDYAMMSHGDTEMDGAFISEGMDAFFLSPGKPQKSTLRQKAQQKQHLLHPSQVAAAQKLMQNNKATISASSAAAPKSSQVPSGGQQQQHDLASPYDFNKVKSTGTNFSQKTQTISNTATSNVALKAHQLEMARKHKELTDRSRSPPRPPASRNNKAQVQNQQREDETDISPGRLYARALKSAKDRKMQRE